METRTLPSAPFDRPIALASAMRERTVSVGEASPFACAEPPVVPERLAWGRKYLATDRFIERGFVARGGMSIVVRAFDKTVDREVALKLVRPESEDGETATARLTAEARTMGYLEHPRIPTVYELGHDDLGVPFISMKLIEGDTLERALEQAHPHRLHPEVLRAFLKVFRDVCETVAFAHGRGVLHRDIKPANIMVGRDSVTYLIDWGVARRSTGNGATSNGPSSDADVFVGTPGYMAPEQLGGASDLIDERADVFGLGAVLYQILTGGPPHDRAQRDVGRPRQPVAFERALRDSSIPRALSRIALKALSHERESRQPSVACLIEDVSAFLQTHRPKAQEAAPLVR
jgi:serine/threonine protein kinase